MGKIKTKQFLIYSLVHAASVPFLLSPDLTIVLAMLIAAAKGKENSPRTEVHGKMLAEHLAMQSKQSCVSMHCLHEFPPLY